MAPNRGQGRSERAAERLQDFGGMTVKRRRLATTYINKGTNNSEVSLLKKEDLEGRWRGTPNGWVDLHVTPEELRPASSLVMGQCFNWRQASQDCWVGILGNRVVAIRQTPQSTLVRCLNYDAEEKPRCDGRATDDTEALIVKLRDYFHLNQALGPMYQEWSEADPRMAAVAEIIKGVRVVRQDPVECIFSFICSSNNNIPRITLMLDKLRSAYGDLLLRVGEGGLVAMGVVCDSDECEEWTKHAYEFRSFPTVNALVQHASEDKLRAMGFGYRAKYIVESAKAIRNFGGEPWALKMRKLSREEVRNQLITLSGVGPKVADCISLFSLDKTDTIPVDVHVWRIACRDYDSSLTECKSLTPTVYAKVGDIFRNRFGQHAGWAHSLLFAAELSSFKSLLPAEMQREMDDFRREEKEMKASVRVRKRSHPMATTKPMPPSPSRTLS